MINNHGKKKILRNESTFFPKLSPKKLEQCDQFWVISLRLRISTDKLVTGRTKTALMRHFGKSFTRIAILTKVSRTIIINSGKKVVVQTGPFCFHCSQEGRLLFYVSLNEIHLFFCMHLGLILMQFFHQLH